VTLGTPTMTDEQLAAWTADMLSRASGVPYVRPVSTYRHTDGGRKVVVRKQNPTNYYRRKPLTFAEMGSPDLLAESIERTNQLAREMMESKRV
jgi:hypothetical protein